MGSIDRGEADAIGNFGDPRQHRLLRGADRHHRAARRQSIHQHRPRGHEPARVRQREHARDMGGGEFTDRVPEEVAWFNVPVLKQPEQRHLERKQRGLGVQHPVEFVGLVG